MSTTAKRLVPGSAMTGVAATYYTAPANTRAVIKSAAIVNTTAGAVPATIYIVPSGGTAAAANTVINNRSVAANETYTCPELINQVLGAGDFIQGLGNGLTLIVSGAEIV
ncbi:MAG: hypothetical protein ACM3VY_00265 [Candidatus Bathyarchaeota archaeon]